LVDQAEILGICLVYNADIGAHMIRTLFDFMPMMSIWRQALQALKLIAILVNVFDVLLGCVFLLIGSSEILLGVMHGLIGYARAASVV